MSTILGIDPGTKEMGFAVLSGSTLLAAGVRTLRNGERPYDAIGDARRIIPAYVGDYKVQLVAIERPLLMPTKRAALVSVITQELRARSKELGCSVVEISARDARQYVVGDPYAKKLATARAIVERHFPELRTRLPKKPRRGALGFGHRDRYWLHMFDAIAVALAARDRDQGSETQTRDMSGRGAILHH